MAARGDVQEQILLSVGSTGRPIVITPTAQELRECCYISPLFGNPAYLTTPDPLKQDETSFYQFYDPNSVTSSEIDIQKCVDGVFITQHTIVDQTYGLFKDFGEEVIDDNKYISIKNINWSKILDDFGKGKYRLQTNEESIFASEGTQHFESIPYQLMPFSVDAANFTTRIKMEHSGLLGDRNDPTKKEAAFPSDWVDMLRIHSNFGGGKSEYEKSVTVYRDGSKNFTELKRIKTYELECDRVTQCVREFFENEIMMADRLLITNYANNMADKHVDLPVQGDSDFDPNYIKQSKLASFTVGFIDAYDNQNKRFC